MLISIITVLRFFVNFWVIFGHFGKEIFFLKGKIKLRKIWNVEDLMYLENWNLMWRISRRIPNSPLPTWGSHLGGGGGVNCLVVFPTYFNPNNSLLIILQISLLFRYTPTLSNDPGKNCTIFHCCAAISFPHVETVVFSDQELINWWKAGLWNKMYLNSILKDSLLCV